MATMTVFHVRSNGASKWLFDKRPSANSGQRQLIELEENVGTGILSAAEGIARTYLNRDEVEASDVCGCYRCVRLFAPTEVTLWADSNDPNDEDPGALREANDKFRGLTAVCPACEDTSVIGSASGATMTLSFLKEMNDYWCSQNRPVGL